MSTKSPRTFTREFKLALCREVQSGHKRPAQLCREHLITEGLLLRWRREFEQRGEAAFSAKDAPEVSAKDAPEVSAKDAPEVSAKDAPAFSAKDAPEVSAKDAPEVSAKDAPEVSAKDALEQKVAQLERFCGQLSLENTLLKKLVSTQRSPNGTP